MGDCPYVVPQRASQQQIQMHVQRAGLTSATTGNNNSFLVKRKQAGGVQFSRDPLNLVNKNSRKVRTNLGR